MGNSTIAHLAAVDVLRPETEREAKLWEKLRETLEELYDAREEVSAASDENTEVRQELSEVEGERDEARTERDQAQKEIQNLRDIVDAESWTDLVTLVAGLEKSRNDAQAATERKEKMIQEYARQASEVAAECNQLRAQLRALAIPEGETDAASYWQKESWKIAGYLAQARLVVEQVKDAPEGKGATAYFRNLRSEAAALLRKVASE